MNTTFIAMGVALLAGIGLVVTVGVFSLLSGAFHFLFAKPRFTILKSKTDSNGFAFSLKWNSSREPAKFDSIRLRLYNPFSTPTQVDVTRTFDAASSSFARDLDFGKNLEQLLAACNHESASVEVEMGASKDALVHHFMFKAEKFKAMVESATGDADKFNEDHTLNYAKPLYHTPKRSFIAEPLPASNKALKISSNPEFAGAFAGSGGDAAAVENFAVSKVWIEPGCIVCDACEAIFPEVFEVTDDSCIIRPGAPLDNGILVEEAAEACPVEVIKFTKA
ncbi:ferredoxin [Halobacteriovorax sp. JY17]|uniref:ferredoxin n=1 Tax=Halobacteriovorax sp. JY17 TaxID=2014617 RepID=UPI0025B9EF48|nr:ferredoxin [Halobacteriovorax sp. JY17]